MKNHNFKSSYTRKTENVVLTYISKPQETKYAKIYPQYDKERYIYLYAKKLINGVPTGTVFPLTAYSVPHLNNMGKFNFIKYIRSNFDIGSLARITLVKVGKKNKHLMLTKIKEIKLPEYKHQKVIL